MIFRYFKDEPILLACVLALSGLAGGLIAYAINTSLKKWKAGECARSLVLAIITAFAVFVLAGIAFEEVFVLEDHSLDLAAAACCSFVFSMLAVHLLFRPLMRIGKPKPRSQPLKVRDEGADNA